MKKKTNKTIIGIYILWCFLHLVFLALGWHGDHHHNFWPFSKDTWYHHGEMERAYDFTEFLVYVLGPILLFFSFNLIVEDEIENSIKDEILLKMRGRKNSN